MTNAMRFFLSGLGFVVTGFLAYLAISILHGLGFEYAMFVGSILGALAGFQLTMVLLDGAE